MLGYYNYTVLLTYLGTLAAFIGMVFATAGNFKGAILCLMAAGFCDMFDGMVARTRESTRPERNFGIQIDSLNDLVSFGVFPAVIVHLLAPKNIIATAVCAGYVLCALIRLAYFNVDELERQEQTDEARKSYRGLPVTTVSLALPLIFCLDLIPGFPVRTAAALLLLVMAALFISPFKIGKPATLLPKLIMAVIGVAEIVLIIFFSQW